MSWLIVVTGRPAAGKSTLAAWLGEQLALPVISKDEIKEVLFDQIGWSDRDWSKVLGRASTELLYYFARTELERGRSVILDNAFHPELASGKLRMLARENGANVLQIICNADSQVLFERFERRARSGTRHEGHVDLQCLDELRTNLQRGAPLHLDLGGSVIWVDTTDMDHARYEIILDRVAALMKGGDRTSPLTEETE